MCHASNWLDSYKTKKYMSHPFVMPEKIKPTFFSFLNNLSLSHRCHQMWELNNLPWTYFTNFSITEIQSQLQFTIAQQHYRYESLSIVETTPINYRTNNLVPSLHPRLDYHGCCIKPCCCIKKSDDLYSKPRIKMHLKSQKPIQQTIYGLVKSLYN